MDTTSSSKDPSPQAPVALIVLTIIVYVAGFAMVGAWFALVVLGQPAPVRHGNAPIGCSVCGVVERVGEIQRAGLQLNGDQGEGFVVLLAALGGFKEGDARPSRMYETAVLHDD